LHEEAIGGEIESAGLHIRDSRNTYRIDWVMIKAICDFADGNKDLNKEEDLKIAF
jgi:hypothetical protein